MRITEKMWAMGIMLKAAINGFGRIGRKCFKSCVWSGKHPTIKVVAVNELAQPDAIAHLLQYDTSVVLVRKLAMTKNTFTFITATVTWIQCVFFIWLTSIYSLGAI